MDTKPEMFMRDPNTGQLVPVERESRADRMAALFSMAYLLGMMAFFFWALFDVWIGRFTPLRWLGYNTPTDLERLNEPIFILLAYAFLGGGLGGTVNGIRSLLTWHSEWAVFERRYVWKYITWPWLGTALALIVFALVRSGVAVLGGDVVTERPEEINLRQTLSTLVVGILSGYGAREVFIWLDAQVSRFFRTERGEQREVPDLLGLPLAEAEARLAEEKLSLGEVLEQDCGRPEDVGRVLAQSPEPKKKLAVGGAVNVTVGARIDGEGLRG
ncbi:MAG: PASTA domain-containing protein [Anaerolineales bacterium]|nr:PASTA domain-containing protein [Anaerolineales bacterium]